MPNNEIIEYIKTSRNLNISDTEIITTLLKKHRKEEIDEAFKHLASNESTQPTAPIKTKFTSTSLGTWDFITIIIIGAVILAASILMISFPQKNNKVKEKITTNTTKPPLPTKSDKQIAINTINSPKPSKPINKQYNVLPITNSNPIPVNIYNPGSENLTNYQVLIERVFDFDFDKNKLGIYDADDNKLHYWIEEQDTDSKKVKIWVKIPKLKTSETKTIYIDFDQGQDLNDGNATFDFFDDFTLSDLDSGKWLKDVSSNYDETLFLNINNSVLKINTAAENSSPKGSHALIKSFDKFAPDTAIRIKERDSGSSWYPGTFGFGQYHPLPSSALIKGIYTHGKYGFFTFNNSFASFQTNKNNYFSEPNYASPPYPQDEWTYDNEWHTFDILWQNSSAKFLKDSSIIAENTKQSAIPAISLPIALGDLGQWGVYSNSETNIDWILVRKYVSPEPIVTIVVFNNSISPSPIPTSSQ